MRAANGSGRWGWIAWVAIILVASACGQAPAPAPSGAPMAATKPSVAMSLSLGGVQLSASSLAPGRRISARVDLGEATGRPVDLEYQWQVDGRRLALEGPTILVPDMRKRQRLRVTVVASEGDEKSLPVWAELSMGNSPPRLAGIDIRTRNIESNEPALEGREQQEWLVEPRAIDPDGDAVEYRYSWIVNGRDSGVEESHFPKLKLRRGDRLSVRVHPSDGEIEGRAVESATIEVGNVAPDILSTPPALDPSGTFVYQVEVRDHDGDRSFAFSLEEAPEGMTLDAASGEIRWRPPSSSAGTHRVVLSVDDRHGARTTQSFDLEVRVGAPAALLARD